MSEIELAVVVFGTLPLVLVAIVLLVFGAVWGPVYLLKVVWARLRYGYEDDL